MDRALMICRLIGIAVVIALTGAVLNPVVDSVPPSKFLKDPEFSEKWDKFRHRGGSEIVILGNSRARSALDPHVLAAGFAEKTQRPVSVFSLATPGGFFPLYVALLEEILGVDKPEILILSVSPRDVLQDATRSMVSFEPYRAYINSSGYQLENSPQSYLAKRVEGMLTNVVSVLAPFIYYRREWILALTPDLQKISLWFFNLAENEKYRFFLRHSINAGQGKNLVPENLSEVGERLTSTWGRLSNLLDDRLPDKRVDNNGFPIGSQSQEEIQLRDTLSREQWQVFLEQNNLREIRGGCEDKDLEMIDPYRDRFFHLAEANKIKVIITLLPYLVLPGCESSVSVNQRAESLLRNVVAKSPELFSLIDLHKNFDNRFQSPEYYSDFEHVCLDKARYVSREFLAEIAR